MGWSMVKIAFLLHLFFCFSLCVSRASQLSMLPTCNAALHISNLVGFGSSGAVHCFSPAIPWSPRILTLIVSNPSVTNAVLSAFSIREGFLWKLSTWTSGLLRMGGDVLHETWICFVSRPTAVNLSDAATKLQKLVLKVAETADEPKTVFEAYIDAAEIMLTDDVNDNKAIGFHGARFLQSQLKDSERLSILTHCNTGSLATAGYGTALGVIRSVHAEGLLVTAFCTETRPFNQGSRLTAFELVHDMIPATLITDSAAAALMKAGRVNAVIVGADRVAANGDTANKIGTYSLAISASFHKIPFYVAAPVTSIDLSLSSGQDIIVEERSAKELLNADGGLGKQVAAPGIAVWNPAFDVTPANLITGIMTEKGVIIKVADDAFDIKGFIDKVK